MSEHFKGKKNSFTEKNWKAQVFGWDKLAGLQAMALCLFFAWFFYRSIFAVPLMIPLGMLFYRSRSADKKTQQARHLRLQFEEMLLSVETNMRAGYSVENAFREARKELSKRYGERELICRRLFSICQGLEHNMSLEFLLTQFGEESGVEEIREFGEVFAAAKRSGGRMSEILIASAQVIAEKINTEEEIQVMLTTKKMEGKIMQVVPFLLVLYLQSSSPGFFDPLYHNIMGYGVMTAMVVLYGTATLWARRIMDIRV